LSFTGSRDIESETSKKSCQAPQPILSHASSAQTKQTKRLCRQKIKWQKVPISFMQKAKIEVVEESPGSKPGLSHLSF
jgi:hypothetical protein